MLFIIIYENFINFSGNILLSYYGKSLFIGVKTMPSSLSNAKTISGILLAFQGLMKMQEKH